MKRTTFLLIPLIIGLVSCNNNGSSPETQDTSIIPNITEVNELKTLLDKQDLSPFHKKSLGTMFTQEYEVLDVFRDEEERSSNYFDYVGLGFLDLYYDLSNEEYDSIVDENGDINVFDAIKEGEGGYRITQSVDMSSFTRNDTTYPINQNLNISQQMTLKTTDEDVYVYNILDVTDKDTFDYASRQNFNGTISKELLFNSVSTRSFRDIFSSVTLFDAPSNIEYLDRLYFLTCRELKLMNDQEISDFIINHNIVMEEVENNIELSFVFTNEDIDEEYQEVIFPGDIHGTLKYNKNSGEFVEYNYKITCLTNNYDEVSGGIQTANMVFECSGKTAREPMGDMHIQDGSTEYDDVVKFLEDVRDQVIPPSIYQ